MEVIINHLKRIKEVVLLRSNEDVVLRFNSVTGRTYSIERSSGLPPTNWVMVTNIVSGTNVLMDVTNRGAVEGGKGISGWRLGDAGTKIGKKMNGKKMGH